MIYIKVQCNWPGIYTSELPQPGFLLTKTIIRQLILSLMNNLLFIQLFRSYRY